MRLIRRNVERIVSDKTLAAKLQQQGFVPLDEPKKAEPAEKEEPEEEMKDLFSMTVQELRAMAKARGVKGAAALNKEDLLEILK